MKTELIKRTKKILRKHKELVEGGVDHSLIKDILIKKYRTESANKWTKLYLKKLGIKISRDTPVSAMREIFMGEEYNIKGFLPNRGDVVLDIGARCGDTALWYAKLFGAKVIAFEPVRKNFELISKNAALNPGLDIEVYMCALGNSRKLKGRLDPTSFLNYSVKGDKEVEFPSERLDSFNLKKVDLAKIDVEGFEYDVLQGAKKTLSKFRPKIVLETHSFDLADKCNKLLEKLGYECTYNQAPRRKDSEVAIHCYEARRS